MLARMEYDPAKRLNTEILISTIVLYLQCEVSKSAVKRFNAIPIFASHIEDSYEGIPY